MIVRYLPIAYDNVMRKHSPHGFMEPAANAFVRYLEVRPWFGSGRRERRSWLFPGNRAPRPRRRLER